MRLKGILLQVRFNLILTFFSIKDINCSRPFLPENGLIIGNCTHTLGSVCSFGCKEGYDVQNGVTKRICKLKAPDDKEGYWDGSKPSCKSRFRI